MYIGIAHKYTTTYIPLHTTSTQHTREAHRSLLRHLSPSELTLKIWYGYLIGEIPFDAHPVNLRSLRSTTALYAGTEPRFI